MAGTLKIPRPKFPRGKNAGGRVEHDHRGTAVWRRSRADDPVELQAPEELAIVDESSGGASAIGKLRDAQSLERKFRR